MIEIIDKKNCTGCSACGDVCSTNAISLEVDEEGFDYPVVDTNKCVDCSMCEMVCPVLHKSDHEHLLEPKIFGAYSMDDRTRMDSTSGGIFSELARIFYAFGGYVGGAVFNEDFTVSQIVSKLDKLEDLRSSKYVQSKATGIYKEIKEILKTENNVLICATPCQIAALNNFLGKDFERLLTVDFLCRGVNSPKVFLNYIHDLEQKRGSKVIKMKFKSKENGWHNFSTRIDFADGSQYCKDRSHDAYFVAYLQGGCFARPSCYDCSFKDIPHVSDITLGDFWGIEKIDSSMDQDKGTSLVIVNTKKGLEWFEKLSANIVKKQYDLKTLMNVNSRINKNIVSSIDRKTFFHDLEKVPFGILIEKYFVKDREVTIKNNFIVRFIKKLIPTYLRRYLHLSYWQIDKKMFKELYDYDLRFNAGFGNRHSLSREQEKEDNIRLLKLYRYCQASRGSIWFYYYFRKLKSLCKQTGVGLYDNLNIGKGLIIGHTGRIVINANAKFSENLFLTHGVTIGRDIRGKRKGVPSFGKNVSIRCNSTVVGNIKIGDDVLIAPNTFVNFDVPSHSVVIGNPATIHHKLNATEGHIGKIL